MLRKASIVALLLSSTLSAAVGISASEYRQRRSKVREALAREQGVLVLYGSNEDERGDLRSRYFQESNFYYLSGWQEPGAVLLLSGEDEYLFLPARSEVKERYTGRKLAPDDPAAPAGTGFDHVLPVGKLELTFFQKLENAKKIYGAVSLDQPSELKRLAGSRPVESCNSLIYPLRQKKSPAEIALLQRAIEVTSDAHRAAWQRAAAGLFEYQISATMVAVYSEAGCERNAYPPIIGSGPNANILHYNRNNRRMDSGELLLMDVGAECAMYAADLTRTIPVNGRFTARQRQIYEVVLGAQRAAIAAVKPGMILGKDGEKSLHKIALEYMNAHGKTLTGEPIGKYFTHGLGHHVGLDVHDPGLPTQPLEPGNVITIEPGLYIPEEGIGVRIEDMVLVTEDGSRLLSGKLLSEPEEIQKILHGRKR